MSHPFLCFSFPKSSKIDILWGPCSAPLLRFNMERELTREGGLQGVGQSRTPASSWISRYDVHTSPAPLFLLCSLAHELRVSCMQRKKVQIQSSDPSALASDRFNLILVSGREPSVGSRHIVAIPWTIRGFAFVFIKPGCVEATSHESRFYGFNKHLPATHWQMPSWQDRLCCDHCHPHYSSVIWH